MNRFDRPKVLQIVADGAPGGGTTAVLGLCEDLAATDAYCVSLLTDRGSYAADQARSLGLRVEEINFFASRLDPRVPLGIERVIADLRPDLVHAHGGRAGLPLSMIPNGQEGRIYTVHGYHFPKKSLPARWLARAAEARIARRVDHGIFVSFADRTIAENNHLFFRNNTVIYNGVDLDDFPVAPVPELTHDLVFSARMHRQKNPMFVLDLMALLAPDGVRLAMVGGGDMELEVKSAAQIRGLGGAIDFFGALPRTDAIKRIRSAKLFLLPSLWEGLPIAPIEAMASGVPVIGSNIPGTDEVVNNGETGILIAGFDPRVWAERIRSVLRDASALEAMRRSGRAYVEERFTRKRSTAMHCAIYNQLITEHRLTD